MHRPLFLLLSCAVCWTFGLTTVRDPASIQLIDLAEQLKRIESQLNSSVAELLTKIDNGNQEIVRLIKATHSSNVGGKAQSAGRQVNALVIIDVQYDFINGSLALRDCPSKHNGEEVIPVINKLLEDNAFDVVVYSHDWHPTNHISFFDNLHLRAHLLTNDSVPLADLKLYSTATFAINGLARMEQALWPRHCVQNTFGAQLHGDLKVLDANNAQNISVVHIQKGTKADIDSYSAFWDNSKLSETKLNEQLKELGVTHVFVTGLATDWCVYSSAMHAIENGYKTYIIEDACRGVDEKTIKERLEDFTKNQGVLIQSDQVKDYVQ